MRSFMDLVGFVVILAAFIYTTWDWVYHYYFVMSMYPSSTPLDALTWFVILFVWAKIIKKTI